MQMTRATLNTIGQAASDLALTLNESLSSVLMRTHQLLRWPVSRGVVQDLRQLESKAYRAWTTFLETIAEGRRESCPVETFEPETLVLDALRWVEPRAREARARISVGIEAGLPKVTADRVVLEQTLLLLLMGSVLAVEESGATIDVLVDMVWDGGHPKVRVAISDERAAPPIAELPGIGASGQGMALVVAKDVVEAMGGALTVKGGPFTGLEATITMPGNMPEGIA
jgi:two-component system sensor histidine kinase DctS